MRNRFESGAVRVAPLLRLFRRHPSIAYRYRIHEDCSESVQAALLDAGLRLEALRGCVDHLGYSKGRAAGRNKRERDGRLLELALGDDPCDLYAHFKRLELARYWNDQELLARATAELVPVLARALPRHRGAPFIGNLLAQAARAQHPNDPRARWSFLQPFAERGLSAEFWYALGEAQEQMGRWEGATVAFNQALQCEDGRQDQYSTVRPILGHCRVALAKGDVQQALAFAARAIALAPADPEAQWVLSVLRTADASAHSAAPATQLSSPFRG
jgi:tetratricopeptide (TPR) repeat protein